LTKEIIRAKVHALIRSYLPARLANHMRVQDQATGGTVAFLASGADSIHRIGRRQDDATSSSDWPPQTTPYVAGLQRPGGPLRPAVRCDKPLSAVAKGMEAMTLGTRLLTWLRGALVGTDSYGNRYYRERGAKPLRRGGGRFSREKRWVIYNGEPEASKVPPEWHAWLHHTIDEVPRSDRPASSVGKAAPAEHDRHALCLSPAGLGPAWRASLPSDRGLRAMDTRIAQRH
jgi:NADH:ubiquinone oxidoreductase subunit